MGSLTMGILHVTTPSLQKPVVKTCKGSYKLGFTMVPRNGTGTRMGLLQQMCTGHLLCVLNHLEAAGALALMLYSLLWEAGNLVNLPDKCIGFYNFCLWNETAGELQCLDYKHLQAMDISLGTMRLATVCVYTCPVLSIFYPLFVAHVKCTEKKKGWKGICIILIIEMILMLGGLGIFLSQTSQWIHTSDFTGGFLALLGTLALLLLQILTTTMYLWWAKLVSEPSHQEVQIEMSQ